MQGNPHVIKEWNLGIGDEHGREYIVTCIFALSGLGEMCDEEADVAQALYDAACTAVAGEGYALDRVTIELGRQNSASTVYDLMKLLVVEKVTDDTLKVSTMDAEREEARGVHYIRTKPQIVCESI